MIIILILGIFVSSFFLTGLLRHYALTRKVIDIPNHRSSHATPVPRGGGIGFVVCFLLVLCWLAFFGLVDLPLSMALGLSGSMIAGLGFWDDHHAVSARWRLLGHFIACGFALFWLGGMPGLEILYWTLAPGAILTLVGCFFLVWLLNLYNFMDGIDGIASIETLSSCGGMAFLYYLCGYSSLMLLPLLLAAAVAGFLVWNFPRARIFMGDAGSIFLGFSLGVMVLATARVHPELFWSWLILLGVFMVDASVTLLRRAFNGDNVSQAHCNHAYQHAARQLESHVKVSLTVLGINIIWLLPMACLAGLGYLNGSIALIIAYIPLVVLAFQCRAGQSERRETYDSSISKVFPRADS